MYAMILDGNRNFLWTEVPDPVRKEGEVLIKVHAAAVNRADDLNPPGSDAEVRLLCLAAGVAAMVRAGGFRRGA